MKTAVVTGASKGIGMEMVRSLVKDGWNVFGLARSAFNIPGVRSVICDVSSEKAVSEAFRHITSVTPQIDLLVANAGICVSGSIENANLDDIRRMFDINLFGAVLCTQKVIPFMRERGRGRIVYTSSMAAPFTVPFQVFYSASKAALNTLCEGVVLETGMFGIEACSLLLGDRKTTITDNRKKNNLGDECYAGAIDRCVSDMEISEMSAPSGATIADALMELLALERLPLYKECDDYGVLYEWSGLGTHHNIIDYMRNRYGL